MTSPTVMLTADQMMDFEELIDALIARLRQEIENASETTAAVSPDNAIGRVSRMDSILAQQTAMAAVRLKEQRIPELLAARRRLDEGTFGTCAKCLEDIELDRLEVAPEATLCKKCS